LCGVLPSRIRRIGIRAIIQQEPDHFHILVPNGELQREDALTLLIHITSLAHQRLQLLQIIVLGCLNNGRIEQHPYQDRAAADFEKNQR